MMNEAGFRAKLRGVQILSAGLIAGLSVISIVLVVVRAMPGGAAAQKIDLGFPLWWVAIGLTVIAVGLSVLVRTAFKSAAVRGLAARPDGRDEGSILALMIGNHILATALVEGSGIVGAVIYFLEGNELALNGPTFAVFWMVNYFPTATSWRREFERIEREVEAKVDSGV